MLRNIRQKGCNAAQCLSEHPEPSEHIIILSVTLTALFASNVLLRDSCRQLINNKLCDASSSQQTPSSQVFENSELCCRSRSGFGVPARLARRRIDQVLESQFLQRLLGHQLAGKHERTKGSIRF